MKNKKKNDITTIKVLDVVNVEVTRPWNGEEWSGEDTQESHYIQGIKIVDGWGDLDIPFCPKPDETYYLVVVNYDTGDSFSRHEGKICFVDLFRDAKKAKDLVFKINSSKDICSIEYEHDDGTILKCSTGNWTGYFEKVNSVHIEEVCLVRW